MYNNLNDCACGLADLTQEQKKQFIKEAVTEEVNAIDYIALATDGKDGLIQSLTNSMGNVVEKVCTKGTIQTMEDNAVYIGLSALAIGGIGYLIGKGMK